MSEADSRPAPTRGRSSVRGGRGGYGRGGPRAGHRQTNGTSDKQQESSLEEQGEIGGLKKLYAKQLPMLKDVFPGWTDMDLVLALQETNGDLEVTIEKITEGHISQFSEIKNPKDRARSKVKDTSNDAAGASSRSGRGRGGNEAGRIGRGRGDRARGASRAGRGGHAKPQESHVEAVASTIPEANSWGNLATDNNGETTSDSSWEKVVASDSIPQHALESTKAAAAPEGPAKKTWASMFSQPKPPPAVAPKAEQASPAVVDKKAATEEPKPLAVPVEAEPSALEEVHKQDDPTAAATESANLPEVLEPPHDPLTEDNLEQLPDTSIPPATQTAASTTGSDARQATPLAGIGQSHAVRPGLAVGGYAQTAMRATGLTPRSASYQRRVAEQQEAVVLPGHNSIDKAAVQFGSMGLNGDTLDAEEDREEPETRTQPPQQSPPGQPRASLPPSAIQHATADPYTGQSMPTPKQAPGLPPVDQQQAYAGPPAGPDTSQHSTQQQQHQLRQQHHHHQQHHAQQPYNQYSRFGQPEVPASSQKPYDPFSHQTPSAFDQFPAQAQQPTGSQGQNQQSQPGGYGGYSAPSDYSQYYTADQRNAYQNYYGSAYGQQQAQPGQETGGAQQRAGSSLGSGQAQAQAQSDNAYGANPTTQQTRYNETQGSGQNTPNPLPGGQHQASGPQHNQHQHGSYPGYPYGHPYYNSPYAAAYQNQFTYSGGYGQAPYGKGGMYGQSQGYGMNAPSSFDHASSPANSAFNQQTSLPTRDSGLGSGQGNYGRDSTQTSSLGGGNFGGSMSDYGRAGSGYQGQGYASQQVSGSEEIKPYSDNKGAGPSPALNQPGRPGSAANSTAAQAQGQTGLPPPQSANQQQGFGGGYPGFNSQSSQYSGLGGLGGHQQAGAQQQGQYGQYSGFGGQNYNQYGRGGWGQSYGH